MSGCGRRHRAKHLTRQFLDSNAWSGPAEGHSMAVCMESPQGQHVRVLLFPPVDQTSPDTAGPTERVVLLPGKFRKVIWLAFKDIIVVADGTTVEFKPAPEQLKNFFRDCPEWKKRLTEAQELAEECKKEMERMPQYAKPTHTTTSVLPKSRRVDLAQEGGDDQSDKEGSSSDKEEELINPNRNNIKHRVQFFDEDEDEDEE